MTSSNTSNVQLLKPLTVVASEGIDMLQPSELTRIGVLLWYTYTLQGLFFPTAVVTERGAYLPKLILIDTSVLYFQIMS